MNKYCRYIYEFIKSIGRWLVNKENVGFYGLIIAFLSLIISYCSFDASIEALEISRKTSIRDSVTSIQMEKNRINDSTLTRYNNYRDSMQQGEMVVLLDKYNKLADGLLKTQMDAGKPKFSANLISITDTVIKKDINDKYRIPFFEFESNNYGNRPAYNLKIAYRLYYPKSKQKYFGSLSEENPAGERHMKSYFIPVVPVIDKDYFFIKLIFTWEDHLLGNRIDSMSFSFFSAKIESKNFNFGNVSNRFESATLEKLEKATKFIDFSENKLSTMVNFSYGATIKKHMDSRTR